jgi:hypothetical protein
VDVKENYRQKAKALQPGCDQKDKKATAQMQNVNVSMELMERL